MAFDDPNGGGKYIAAYVVSDGQVDINKLNDFIKETKPPYMVPAVTMQRISPDCTILVCISPDKPLSSVKPFCKNKEVSRVKS